MRRAGGARRGRRGTRPVPASFRSSHPMARAGPAGLHVLARGALIATLFAALAIVQASAQTSGRTGIGAGVRRAPEPRTRRCQGRLRERRLPHPLAQPAGAARGEDGPPPARRGPAARPAAGAGAGRQSPDPGEDRAGTEALLRPAPVDQRHPLLRRLPRPGAGVHQQRAAHPGGRRGAIGAAQLPHPLQRRLPEAPVPGRTGAEPGEPGLAADDRPQRNGGALHRLRDPQGPAHARLRRKVRGGVRRPRAGHPDHRPGAGELPAHAAGRRFALRPVVLRRPAGRRRRSGEAGVRALLREGAVHRLPPGGGGPCAVRRPRVPQHGARLRGFREREGAGDHPGPARPRGVHRGSPGRHRCGDAAEAPQRPRACTG